MPWDLDAPSTTFFGIEETIFRAVRRIITNGRASADGVAPFVVDRTDASPLVVHRDGLVMGPLNYFGFEGVEQV